jgi:hypothetical protein
MKTTVFVRNRLEARALGVLCALVFSDTLAELVDWLV